MRESRRGKRLEIRCDDSGVTLLAVPANDEPQLRLAWEQITSVYAYKRDGLAADQIRLVLGDDGRQSWIEATEDDIGFQVLIAELARRLPDFPGTDDWWDKLALPPFETNWTQLYGKRADATR